MRLISTILLSNVVALGAVSTASMAQNAPPQPPASQAGPPEGGFRGGAGAAARPVHPPAEGGAYGVISAASAKGFTIMQVTKQAVAVELTPNTAYRMGNAKSSARAIKVGQRVRVLGAVAFGTGPSMNTTIAATHVVLQPVEGAGTEISLAVSAAVVEVLAPVQREQGGPGGQAPARGEGGARGPGGPGGPGPGAAAGPGGGPPGARAGLDMARQGLPVPARHIGNLNPDWGDAADSRTSIAAGEEADKAIEVAMAAPYAAGGLVDRVVKEPDGTFLVHNIGTSWPHHIFVSPDFKLIGAAN